MRDFLRRLFLGSEPVTVDSIAVTAGRGVVTLTLTDESGDVLSWHMPAEVADQLSMSLYRQAASAILQEELAK